MSGVSSLVGCILQCVYPSSWWMFWMCAWARPAETIIHHCMKQFRFCQISWFSFFLKRLVFLNCLLYIIVWVRWCFVWNDVVHLTYHAISAPHTKPRRTTLKLWHRRNRTLLWSPDNINLAVRIVIKHDLAPVHIHFCITVRSSNLVSISQPGKYFLLNMC